MRGFKTLALVATASVLLAGSLQAQWEGQVKWGVEGQDWTSGVNGASSRYSSGAQGSGTRWNVYTSPYFAQFKISNSPTTTLLPPPAGSSTWGPVVDIFCVDLGHYANTSTSGYNALFTNLSNLSTTETNKTTRQVGTTGLANYLAAAYLATKIREYGVTTAAAKDMNGAIWQIMSSNPYYRYTDGNVGTTNYNYDALWSRTGIDYWVTQAKQNAAGAWGVSNKSNWVVVTDGSRATSGAVTLGGSQEYLTQVTPEPATMLLLGTGLVVMLMAAGALRRPVA